MKRTLLLSIIMIAVVSIFSLSLHTNLFASQNAGAATLLPYFSVKLLNGVTPISGSSVTITGPNGTTYHTTGIDGKVCTSQNYGNVRVTWSGPSRDLYGCKDINHQSQTE